MGRKISRTMYFSCEPGLEMLIQATYFFSNGVLRVILNGKEHIPFYGQAAPLPLLR